MFRSNALACAVGILTGGARTLVVFSDYLPGAVYPCTYTGLLDIGYAENVPSGQCHAGVNAISTRSSVLEDEPTYRRWSRFDAHYVKLGDTPSDLGSN